MIGRYNCSGYKSKILVSGSVQARLCHYTGNYYCPVCHWNDARPIPGLVIQNWDFTERRVCRTSFRQLNQFYKKILINIEQQNPQLFSFVEELQQIKKLRQGKQP